MLSRALLRDSPERVIEGFERRSAGAAVRALEEWADVDGQRRGLTARLDEIRSDIKSLSQVIGPALHDGTPDAELRVLKGQARELAKSERRLVTAKRGLESRARDLELALPNLLDPSVPPGGDDASNVVERTWGCPPRTSPARAHHELGTALGILDFERAAKTSGRKYTFLVGAAARLEHALIRFMREHHEAAGDLEVLPPYIVGAAALEGCGQLPKFDEELFRLGGEDAKYLIPTAEVPLTYMHADEVLAGVELPLRYFAVSPCFRAEAGASGQQGKAYLRQHVFHKVELVRFCTPDQSASELDAMIEQASSLLERLGLHHRVVRLCAAEVADAANQTWDIEVWLPSRSAFVEVSSCSTYGTFQSLRSNIRYEPASGGKPRPCHTLNGSALAVGRTLVAVLEQGQRSDGSIQIPPALVPYFGAEEIEAHE